MHWVWAMNKPIKGLRLNTLAHWNIVTFRNNEPVKRSREMIPLILIPFERGSEL